MYANGRGVAKDEKAAVAWFRMAGDQGDAAAQSNLGVLYVNGRGVAKDEKAAAAWFHKAAQQGDADAQFNLGINYAQGRGVEQDDKAAAEWFRKAAEHGDADAQLILGLVYYTGRGVKADEKVAAEWYRKAAEQGKAQAQFHLGALYTEGRAFPKDEKEAVKWYQKAADQGYAEGQCSLAAMYSRGEGVPKNLVFAYKWRLLAASQGDSISKEAVRALESIMTPGQIAEGQRLAAAFVPVSEGSEAAGSPGVAAGRPRSLLEREGMEPAEPRRAGREEQTVKGWGTGFFISPQGHILTADHVVSGAARVMVRDASGLSRSARVLRRNEDDDIAVLKIERVKGNWLQLAGAGGGRMGESVFTIGFPNPEVQGEMAKFSDGRISSLSGIRDDPRNLQLSIPALPGNSGGPVLDGEGRVIGMLIQKLNDVKMLEAFGNAAPNVSYAVKSAQIARLITGIPQIPRARNTGEASDDARDATISPENVEQARRAVVLISIE